MDFLTTKELSAKLKISIPTINRLIAEGMPKLKIRGSNRFDYNEIVEWFKNKQNNKK